MAAVKILSVPQLSFLSRSLSLSVSQNNLVKERVIKKKLGLPEKPKRPPNGFLAYVADIRASVMVQNPDMSFTEISKLLGKNWKEMPESEKQKYITEFKRRLEQYKMEVKEYNRNLTDTQKCEINELVKGFRVAQKEKSIWNDVKKLEREMNKPKRPHTPFALFCAKYSENYKGTPPTQKVKELAAKWRELNENEKEKYKAIYRKENEQYKKVLEKWEQQMIQQGNVDLVRLKTLKEKIQKYVQ